VTESDESERKFATCPVCGSDARFFEGITKKLIEKGFARPEAQYCLHSLQGVVTDQAKEQSIPIGSEVPAGYVVKTDICINCGAIYAIELRTYPVKKTIPPVNPKNTIPFTLNRAQRRHPPFAN
jgi:hypothetical protein